MNGSKDFCTWPPPHVLLDDQVARVEVALWTNPGVIADDAPAIEAALNVGLFADEHAVADTERLGMLEHGVAADADAVAELARQRAPGGAAHQRVEVRVARAKTGRKVEQSLPRGGATQVLGQLNLELRVR